MWNEFITAFSPFFDSFFGMVNDVLGIFLNPATDPVTGLPVGLSLFGVPILGFFIAGFVIYYIFVLIFQSKG